MRIEVVNKRNYPVNDKLKDVIERKVSKIEKYFDEDVPLKVYLKSEGDKCRMELQLLLGKTFLSAEATEDNMYDAIDKVIPKIEKQIAKHKTKIQDRTKVKISQEAVYSTAEVEEKAVVKVKEFKMEAMSIDEAMYQLDMSGHDFFVFLDETSNTVKVVYKRYDDNYGIIVPKV